MPTSQLASWKAQPGFLVLTVLRQTPSVCARELKRTKQSISSPVLRYDCFMSSSSGAHLRDPLAQPTKASACTTSPSIANPITAGEKAAWRTGRIKLIWRNRGAKRVRKNHADQ